MKPLNRRQPDRRMELASTYEALTTRELLQLHERHFGALDPRARARILAVARSRDRADDWRALDGLAA